MLKLEYIEKSYGLTAEQKFYVLNNISLEFQKGEFVSIIGKSGAGKTTLLNVLGLIDGFESGEYYIDDVPVSKFNDRKRAALRNEKIGIVLQDFALINNYTVYDNVVAPLYFSRKAIEKRKRVKSVLEKVGISHLINKKCKNLSGGEKQRVAIARAIVNSPKIILADEPTGNLDEENGKNIFDILKQLNKLGLTVIMVTHDMDLASKADRVIRISGGEIVE